MTSYLKATSLIIFSFSILLVLYYIQPKGIAIYATTVKADVSNNCSCTDDLTLVEHGEHQPVIVPDTMPELASDILQKIQANRLDNDDLLITVATYDMRFELYNWIAFMKAAKEDRFLILCTDSALYQHLTHTGYKDQAVLVSKDWSNSGTVAGILQRLVYLDINPLMLDINQLVLQPRTREYLSTLMHIRWNTQLIVAQDSQSRINSGFIYLMRDSYPVKRLMALLLQTQMDRPDLTLQEAFNKTLDQFPLDLKSGFTLLLDALHFPDGESYFSRNLSKEIGINPYMVHVNHKVKKIIICLFVYT